MKLRHLLISSMLMIAAFVSQASAQSDAPAAETDPVLVFNRICYAQVPLVRKIEDMAIRLAWVQMGEEDLEQFTTLQKPDLLLGWDVSLAERLYRLGVVQSDVNEQLSGAFPDFADGQMTSCSLVLDGSDEADVVLARMNLLAQKEPSSFQVPEGALLTTTWSGGNEDFKVFLFFKSDANDKASLLSVTILSKEKS